MMRCLNKKMNQNCKYTSCNQVKEAGDQKWANELIIIIIKQKKEVKIMYCR